MRQKRIFQQPLAAMPISGYASAIFFVRRDRVTLKGFRSAPLGCDCSFKSVPGHAAFKIAAVRRDFHKSGLLHTGGVADGKNTDPQEFRTLRSTEQRAREKKKPGTAGLFDEYLFQSVHFASLAI
jgi:hypothetical protein